MSIEIQGNAFTGFPGRDFNNLRLLDFQGRIQWVRFRYESFFLDTFDRIVALEKESYIWLCVVNLLTSAIEALAHFEFDDARGMTRFARFVERYLGPEYRLPLQLNDAPGARTPAAITAAEHLYKYFRSGLAHSFCIEWGGLLHREDGAPAYVFETAVGPFGEKALGISPRDLVADFRRGVETYFQTLEQRQGHELETIQFNRRFEEVYLNKVKPPVP